MTIERLNNNILDLRNTKNKLSNKIKPIYNAMNKNKSGVAINIVVGKITTGMSSLPTLGECLRLVQQGHIIVDWKLVSRNLNGKQNHKQEIKENK